MPTPGNAINEATTGITGFTGTAFVGTPVTQYNVLTGASTSSTLNNVAPSATSGVPLISQGAASQPVFGTAVVAGGGTGAVSLTNHGVLVGQATSPVTATAAGSAGQVLQSGGASADPTYSTATYPSTATGTGKILRADGTNWVATTATYPDTAGTSGNVLTSDGTNWVSSAATGNVTGPGSSTDNALVRFDGTTGKIIQNGVITEDDTGNLSIAAAVSGGNLSALVSNTSNTASAQAFFQAQVAGSTANDAYIETNINGGQAWSFGLDNSASDAFVISSNATLGTNNVMSAATSGEIIFPLQSAFMAILGTTDNNVTGDGTVFTIGSGNALTEIFDQNNDFVTTGTYTCPVTSKVTLGFLASYLQNTSASTSAQGRIVTSNRTFGGSDFNPVNASSAAGRLSITFSILCDMDAADTATFAVVGSNGAKTVLIGGTSTFERTWVWGNISC